MDEPTYVIQEMEGMKHELYLLQRELDIVISAVNERLWKENEKIDSFLKELDEMIEGYRDGHAR